MASFSLKLFCFCFFLTIFVTLGSSSLTQLDDTSLKLMSDALEWPTTMSLYDELADDEDDGDDGDFVDRRSLFWRGTTTYYISYGALSANRIPCPPRSGRSYYTHNCFKARGPVHPYTRGCSRISRCRR
ncbi:hypothetical protein L484_011056 [Morus notabilis]|uniref:Protein RALF-like 34 n=2 Tax=Morus notabilis TaxID=981085 RepID=W9R4K2_9ROSA|nr:protein RALF-like 34 [Morus notabilis]EXB54394.1 hypothetical protein L484_011056 [Morus notabilis]